MRGIDEPIVLERGERTSLRQLATEGRLTLRRSGSYGPDPESKTRMSLWTDVRPRTRLGNERRNIFSTESARRAEEWP